MYGFVRRRNTPSEGRPLIRRVRDGDPWPLLWLGVPVVVVFAALAGLNVGGQAALWENAHWTLAGLLATAVAANAARVANGPERRFRVLIAVGCASWLAGQLTWVVQSAVGYYSLPAPSDIGFMFLAVPAVVALLLYLHGRLPHVEEIAVYLDSAAIFLTITGVILAVYGAQVAGLGFAGAAVTVAYPIVHLAMAGGGLVILVASGARPRFGGAYLILVGFAILGTAILPYPASSP